MNFTQIKSDHSLTVALQGNLNQNTAKDFQEYFSAVCPDAGSELVLDLAGLETLTGSGIRELMILSKRLGEGRLSVINANESILRVARTCGVSGALRFHAAKKSRDIRNMSIRELIDLRAGDHPGTEFIRHAGHSYTWKDMAQGTDVIASELYRAGVTRHSHVGLFAANSVNWILCFFAIQRLGAVAVLINSKLTSKELEEMLEMGDVSFLCYDRLPENCGSRTLNHLSGSLCIGSEKDFISAYKELSVRFDFNIIPVEADDPAVMLFTSGSTGKPRGVLISGSTLLRASLCCCERDQFPDDTVRGATVPLSHLLGLQGCLGTAMVSDTRIAIPEDYHMSGILECLRHECTGASLVPTVLAGMIASPNYTPDMLTNTRFIVLAGAAVSPDQLSHFRKMVPNASFHIVYAMSEDLGISMSCAGDSIEKLTSTSGKIVDSAEIISSSEGEILTRSDFLMIGYYNVSPQEQSYDADGWIHTGDMGYLDEEGYLHLTGRIKELINRGGEKILPNEVISALTSCHGIADAKVIGVPDSFYGEIVTAALVLKDGYIFDEKAVRTALRKKLAAFKIPVCFKVFDHFPTLANGKADMVTLRALMAEHSQKGATRS